MNNNSHAYNHPEFVFVFGSNLAGIHGAGAALYAEKFYGAKKNVGEGLTGNSYALPTKDENIKTRSLDDIEESIEKFLICVSKSPDKHFGITPVGTGLAGYSKGQIIRLFMKYAIPDNAFFYRQWFQE